MQHGSRADKRQSTLQQGQPNLPASSREGQPNPDSQRRGVGNECQQQTGAWRLLWSQLAGAMTSVEWAAVWLAVPSCLWWRRLAAVAVELICFHYRNFALTGTSAAARGLRFWLLIFHEARERVRERGRERGIVCACARVSVLRVVVAWHGFRGGAWPLSAVLVLLSSFTMAKIW